MNHWYQMRRLRGAVILITIGALALLDQWHIMRFEVSWPLILIVLGLMKIAERAAWSADVRRHQEEQGVPVQPPNSSWLGGSPAPRSEAPFVQTTPPMPEEPGREEQ